MSEARPGPGRSTAGASAVDHGISVHHSPDTSARPLDRAEATKRQKEQYGGIKFGSAFFGWLTATGTALLLTALLAAAGAAVGVTTGTSVSEAVDSATANADASKTVGLAGGIALLVILFL